MVHSMTFADKTTLGQSAVLGLQQTAHLTQNQFNWLGTVFYLSYLVFQYPQNLALQYLPVGKWMALNIFVWVVALLSHAACKSFGALFAVRFILGMCEGAITPGFLLVTSMFYTRQEQTRRVGYWFLMNGIAVIFLGFVSFGLLHTHNANFAPWQWLMIITGLITLVTSVCFFFFFPDGPTTAWFLTPEERVMAVQRIKENQTGVKNAHFKREQLIETLRDPKTWLFFFFAAIANIVNSLTNQRQIIVSQFGFSPINTTLIGCVDGVVEIVTIGTASVIASYWKNGRAFTACLMFIPAILGSILVITLPAHLKIGLLFSYWLSIFAITPFVIFLSWTAIVTAGHTKRAATNAIVLSGYAIGNAAAPFMWKKRYQPRNNVPWAIITGASFISGLLLLAIRFHLARENAKREKEGRKDGFDNVYVAHVDADGKKEEVHVDRAFLDLTDRENREFRYVL
ncbi:major facilitator superfamily domain-containing protein [Amylostereum chailletii]|nr:major facilitator superfamily domain-containing protein [Amylostereum chailletii]